MANLLLESRGKSLNTDAAEVTWKAAWLVWTSRAQFNNKWTTWPPAAAAPHV